MSAFKEHCFTPSEFARLAKIEKSKVNELIKKGELEITRKRVGNVDRKMVTLITAQNYFKNIRTSFDLGRHGDPVMEPVTSNNLTETESKELVATATPFAPCSPNYKVQMFYNVKGGTGKSTLTAQYVMRAAMLGLKVLAIDLDGQGHLSVNLDILDAHERPTVYDILINDLNIKETIFSVAPGLDIIPASLGLCNIEIPLNLKPRREYRLSEAILQVKDDYDLIVADTNPAASILNSSMLVAADLVNVVCATNPLSFHGMSLVIATIEEMEREFQRDLAVKIIPNMYDNREVISQEVLGELKSQFTDFCTEAVVNRSADLNEATKRRATVWSVNTKGNAANDIGKLTEELLYQ